ncbi:unnamed protein product, partial [Discosporangium mesarthrocarpum]
KGKPYNDRSDVWALGIILYECCMLKHPFTATNQCALIFKIIKGDYEAVPTGRVPPAIQGLVPELLAYNSRKRPSTREILS